MATQKKLNYATPGQLTCTLASLASGSARESQVQTNTLSGFDDYEIVVTFTLASGSPSTNNPCVNIYASGSMDNSLWPKIQLSSGAPYITGGGDSSVGALGSVGGLRFLGTFALQTTTSSGERTFTTEPMSVASAFYGTMPEAFSIIVENQSGVAFSSSTTTTAEYVQATPLYTTYG